jgi:hypothetical protein
VGGGLVAGEEGAGKGVGMSALPPVAQPPHHGDMCRVGESGHLSTTQAFLPERAEVGERAREASSSTPSLQTSFFSSLG